MTNQQGAPEAPNSTALDGKTELFHVSGYPLLVRAVDFNRLYAENAALQQGYDAARLEIDHLRGAKKSKLLAQPVAWMVYLPSIDTQHLYYSQEDMGYVDDVTNHADAEVTPLYEMAAPKAEVETAGEYPAITTEFINKHVHPSQAAKLCRADWSGKDESSVETVHPEVIKLLHAYVDADRAMRAQAAHAAVAGQCEDAIELLGKYKELCEEIKRGDSYHIGRIDAAISVLAQAAPQPAVQQGAPVAWRSWDSENSRWNFTLWPDEWAGHADVWEPLYTTQPAPVAQGDARAEQALLKVLTAVQRYLPPDGPSAHDTLTEIIEVVDPWPLGQLDKS